jgi:archaellum component FlaF (FlaF/FlaG flagellin family)
MGFKGSLAGTIVLIPMLLVAFEMYMNRFNEYKPTLPGNIRDQ